MDKLFGVQINTLLIGFLVAFALGTWVLAVAALRNRVIFNMGIRNIPRRPANTVLICLGLMLAATIFSASFATGDTLTHSIRSAGVRGLGEVDVMVMGRGTTFGAFQQQFEGGSISEYFDASETDRVSESLDQLIEDGVVEGIAPSILETLPVRSPATRLNEPAVALLSFDHRYMDAFAPLVTEDGDVLSIEELETREGPQIFVSTTLAEKLEAGPGDEIEIFFGAEPTLVTVADVYESGGNPTSFTPESAGSMVAPLSWVQSQLQTNRINFILITSQGGILEGARHTDAIMEVLDRSLEDTALKAEPVKQDALDGAEESGAVFTTIFVAMGSFSIIAGILLIFLIFVMLAAERKPELGIARAVGAQRGHVVRVFTFEGMVYALIASAVGSGLGLLVSWGMIQVMAAAFKEMGFEIAYDFTIRGLALSYLMGVVLTLVVVVISAWWVSRLNIVAAIKDIPETKSPQRRHLTKILMLIAGLLCIYVGLTSTVAGLSAKLWTPYAMGISLLIIGAVVLSRRFGLHERATYTSGGIALLVFWLLPARYHPYGEEMGGGFELFVLSGVMMVAAAVMVVMYNSDLLLGLLMTFFGRLRALTPMIKTAVSYPMASRFRTGMTVGIFALIIFTLVIMSAIIESFNGVLNDTDRVAGGFHIRAEVLNRNNTIPDIHAAMEKAEGVDSNDFERIAGFTFAQVSMRDLDDDSSDQPAQASAWETMSLVGMDDAYAEADPYDFQLKLERFESSAEVWEAVANDPSLAVISAEVAPSRSGGQMGPHGVDFKIGKGDFSLEDESLPEGVYFEVMNPATKETERLQVVGVVEVMAGIYAYPVTVSQQTLRSLGYDKGPFADPVSYRFRVRPEKVDEVPEIAKSLEQAFVENGANAVSMAQEIKDFGRLQTMFFNLSIAFMALGLVVGIAALGVIAARAVVERRQQIGMLRAIGFRQGMIQFTFLTESSFVALLGITVGVALGVISALLFMDSSGVEGMEALIPWGQIVLITVLAYLASLTTTFIPAYRAARIYPAEALRYE